MGASSGGASGPQEQEVTRASGAPGRESRDRTTTTTLGDANAPQMFGRYALYGEIARGGMATVHFGRLVGPVGFSRTVAIKRLHPQFAADEEFVGMFLDEARLAARIQHPNVVQTVDVVAGEGELMLVMEYVQGESLSRILTALRHANERVPYRIVGAIVNGILVGLHAAHEAKNERGEPLGIVHRDMSPQNVLVGSDGVVRVFDFGVAKAHGRIQDTREGIFKGKLAYASPEQLMGQDLDRRLDIYAASVILWEIVCGRRMFKADNEMQLFHMVREGQIDPPSRYVPDLPQGLEPIILRGLATDPNFRWASAREMAIALEEVLPHASAREVAEWVNRIASNALKKRATIVEEIDRSGPMTDSGVRDLLPTLVRGATSSRPANGPVSDRNSVPGTQVSTLPAVAVDRSAPIDNTQAQEKRRGRALVFVALLVLISVFGGVLLALTKPWETKTDKIEAKKEDKKEDKASSKQGKKATDDDDKKVVATPPPEPPKSAEPSTQPKIDPPKPGVVLPPKPLVAPPPASSAAPKPSVSAAPPVNNCNPPFTIDADGIRHPKPECM